MLPLALISSIIRTHFSKYVQNILIYKTVGIKLFSLRRIKKNKIVYNKTGISFIRDRAKPHKLTSRSVINGRL